MVHLTIAIDEQILDRAQSKASQEGTSVDRVLSSYLEEYAGIEEERERAVRDLLDLSRRVESGRGDSRWTRDELHDR